VGGSPVTGSPFTVVNGDNSIHFFGTGATVINQSSGETNTINQSGKILGSGKVIH